MYFHFLHSHLNLKTKHFQRNAFLKVWESEFSLRSITTELPNITINKDHKLYGIFSCLLFWDFSTFLHFLPQGKRARNALIFYLLQENWELKILAHLQGWGRQLGCRAPHQMTDSRTAKLCHTVLRLAAVVAFALLRALEQARKGRRTWYDLSSSPALPQGPEPPSPPGNCSQRPSAQHRHKERSLGSMVPEVRPLLPLAWQWQKSPAF